MSSRVIGDYENGIGVDPVGGVEAIISHYISKEFQNSTPVPKSDSNPISQMGEPKFKEVN